MNEHQIDQFNQVVKRILKNSQLKNLICIMNKNQSDNMVCCLDNKLYYYLNNQLNEISNQNPNLFSEKMPVNKIIHYHQYCKENKIDFNQILQFIKDSNLPRFILGGNSTVKNPSKTKSTASVILQGITATLRSIIDRKFDKNEIDQNLIEGAREREMLLNTNKHLDPTLSVLDTTSTKKTNYLVGQISTKPGTEGQNSISKIDKPIILPSSSTERNNAKAVEIMKNITSNDPLDYQISMPLSEPPVGKTAATIIEDPSNNVTPIDQAVNGPGPSPISTQIPSPIPGPNAIYSKPVEYITVDSNK